MGMQSCQPLRFGCSLLYPSALHYAAMLMIISLCSPSGKLKLFIFNPMRCVWASDSPAYLLVSEVLVVPQPIGIRVLTSWPIVVFGSIPTLMHHFLVRQPPFSVISNRHAEARSWKRAPRWWISSKENAHQKFWEEYYAVRSTQSAKHVKCFSSWDFLSSMAECTTLNIASTWSVTSTKEKWYEVRWRFPINFYGLWDAVFTAFGCNLSGDTFHKFLCSAQHCCLSSQSWQLFWRMFLQMQIAKEDHYIYATLKI